MVSALTSLWGIDTTTPQESEDDVSRAQMVSLTAVVSQGWITGSVEKWRKGEHRISQRRNLSCRVEDAPAEVAELMGWLVKSDDEPHPTFDL